VRSRQSAESHDSRFIAGVRPRSTNGLRQTGLYGPRYDVGGGLKEVAAMKGPETVTNSNRTSTSHPGSGQGARAQTLDLTRSRRGLGPGVRCRADDSAGDAQRGPARRQCCSSPSRRAHCARAGSRLVPAAGNPPAQLVAAGTSTAVRKPVPNCAGFTRESPSAHVLTASITAISGRSPSERGMCTRRGGLGCHRLRDGDQPDQGSVLYDR
jgi:hypothetical protein